PYVFQDLATPALYSLSLHDALPICQDPVSGDADRQQRRLGVVREPQFLFRTLETEAAQRKAQGGVGFLEHFPGDSESLIQVPPHADGLRPLAGEHEGEQPAHAVTSRPPHRMATAPQVRPAPKPTQTIRWPGWMRPASSASPRAMGIEAADVFP